MTSSYTKKELDKFYNLLIERRTRLNEEITAEKDSFKQSEGTGDLVDMATSLLERELDFSLTEKERKALEEIENALERIKKITYGICIDTHEMITEDRLLAVPEALRTLKAQQIYESKRKKKKRLVSTRAFTRP